MGMNEERRVKLSFEEERHEIKRKNDKEDRKTILRRRGT
jgi:hypothetical protein